MKGFLHPEYGKNRANFDFFCMSGMRILHNTCHYASTGLQARADSAIG